MAHEAKSTESDPMLESARQAAAAVRDEKALCEAICRAAVEQGHYRMAWVGLLQPGSRKIEPLVHWGHDEGYLAQLNITTERTKDGFGPTGTAVREGRTVVNNDFRATLISLPWRDPALERILLSSAALPLFVRGVVLGALNVYSGEPYYFTPERVKALEELAAILSRALEDLRPAA